MEEAVICELGVVVVVLETPSRNSVQRGVGPMEHGQCFSSEEKGIAEGQMILISEQVLIHLLRGENKRLLLTESAGKSTQLLRRV